jgi:ribosome-associated heat shock protein Hsp15
MVQASKIRIDKWLWAVRIFKTRAISTDACNSGKVKIEGKSIKPSRAVKLNDTISVQKGIIKFIYEVTGLIEKRVSAKIASENVKDLTSEKEKFKMKAASAQPVATREKGMGRPTKKDRRDIEKLKWGK